MPAPSLSRTLFALALAALAAAPPSRAQAPRRTVLPLVASLNGRYTSAGTRADSLSEAAGPGLAVRADVFPERRFGLTVHLAYDALRLRTPGAPETLGSDARVLERADAVNRWNWAHWRTQYRGLIRTYDTDISATLTPVEAASVYSLALTPSARVQAGPLRLAVSAGPSAAYARRTLYLRERWAKAFPEVSEEGGYTFAYEIRNDAPDRTGYGLGLDAGLDARLRLTRLFHAVGAVRYRRYLVRRARTDNGLGSVRVADDLALPFNDLLGFELGLALR